MTAIERCGTTLPEDLLIEILILLPVVSLVRFKSVSKSWFSLIGSSHFVSRHLRLNNRLFVVTTIRQEVYGNSPTTANFVSLNDPQHSNYAELVPRDQKWGSDQLVACFNGIICLAYNSFVDEAHRVWVDDLSLWNPATKQLRTLPPPHHKTEHSSVSYGFGFDSQTSDYKLVRILQPYSDKLIPSRAEVYSLSRDSWRIVDAGLPLHVEIVSNPRMPFQDDDYLWVAWGGSYSIISFNFGSDTFGNIPLPDDLAEDKNTLELAFVREKIACISSAFTSDASYEYTMWLLDDNWVKMYTFCPDNVYPNMMTFLTDGRIILKKCGTVGDVLRVYDPRGKEMKEVPTQGVTFYDVAQYKESLVSVKRQDGI